MRASTAPAPPAYHPGMYGIRYAIRFDADGRAHFRETHD